MASFLNKSKRKFLRRKVDLQTKHRSLAYDQMDIGEEDGEHTAEWYVLFLPIF